MNLFVASDHAGFALKSRLIKEFKAHDMGPFTECVVDYPEYIKPLVANVLTDEKTSYGILICGSGIGMAIGANRFAGIRAFVAHSLEEVLLARSRNNANVLCLASRLFNEATNIEFVYKFISSSFDGGRHERRIKALDHINGSVI
jgi:ribose 5-phosphate isomerase B